VGSEMCIRDRAITYLRAAAAQGHEKAQAMLERLGN